MNDQQQHLEEVLQFLHEHRNNENHFEKIYAKLEEECNRDHNKKLQTYGNSLQELKEKQAEAYHQSKETGRVAWPEFEKFTSGFEKAVTTAIKELGKADR